MVKKWENLEADEIIKNYIRLKESQREKNKASYEKLKQQPKKYYNFLNQVSNNQKIRLENIKADPELNEIYKEQRKLYNSNYYYNKKLEQYETATEKYNNELKKLINNENNVEEEEEGEVI